MSTFAAPYEIIKKEEIAAGIFSVELAAAEVAACAVPGQFVHIKAEGFTLRRPISVCCVNGEILRIVLEVRGAGTAKIAAKNTGDRLDIIAPLGRGFSVPGNGRVIAVGGGIGVPPLVFCGKTAAENNTRFTSIIGFRDQSRVILEKDLLQYGEVIVCTDDGSYGKAGYVTDALQLALTEKAEKPDIILACGPLPMLRGVAEIAARWDIPSELSLEERMGCGMGACAVCACKTVRDGNVFMQRVCRDGPVFPGEEVDFDE
ncbi:dihydroorotate dehydrogenase B (NAD(+)), electron transfer subunit [Clostridia bacterium]|nr:dihydroorotate dehydrogenase B (NAD(+)), electron transfer subunit [Clostridia bacterium]